MLTVRWDAPQLDKLGVCTLYIPARGKSSVTAKAQQSIRVARGSTVVRCVKWITEFIGLMSEQTKKQSTYIREQLRQLWVIAGKAVSPLTEGSFATLRAYKMGLRILRGTAATSFSPHRPQLFTLQSDSTQRHRHASPDQSIVVGFHAV